MIHRKGYARILTDNLYLDLQRDALMQARTPLSSGSWIG